MGRAARQDMGSAHSCAGHPGDPGGRGTHRGRRPDAPALAGTVADAAQWRIALLPDQPSPGTAILAVEGHGEQVAVSVWSYLCGPDGATAAERDEPRWRAWLTERAPHDRLT